MGMSKDSLTDMADLSEVYTRPGFKIRRCHQFAVSIFAEECQDFDLTTTQCGLLTVIRKFPGIEQIAAARLLGLDRSTTGSVVSRLEERGLIRRVVRLDDKRRRQLILTEHGEAVMVAVQPAMQMAQERLLEPLDPEERVLFQRCLDKLLDAFNQESRVPLEPNAHLARKRRASRSERARSESR